MKQYCRYCSHAFDYNGEGTDFLCEANAECGDNGCGHFYNASKAKRPNKCKHFELNEMDIFNLDRLYKPREPYKSKAVQAKEAGQLSMNMEAL